MPVSNNNTILHVVGARPNFMKIAPILRAGKERHEWQHVLVHTGQHYDSNMSDSFFRDLQIPAPDIHLGVGSGSHGMQTARVLEGMERVLLDLAPELVVVVGDVNSTLAAALAAAKLHIPVAHVEAGLRSGDRRMPEELNRILTDQLSSLCLTPSRDAHPNLQREGIPDDRIHFVGNVMIDSLLHAMDRARQLDTLDRFQVRPKGFFLATLHRPSNVDHPDQLREILSAFRVLGKECPVLLPLHPRTRSRIHEFSLDTSGIVLTPPLGYHEILQLQEQARLVLTDSGGIQEETTVLGVPCLTLRSSTERPITLTEGTNTLVPDRRFPLILEAVTQALSNPVSPRRPEGWDGRAGRRIVDAIASHLLKDSALC